MNRIFVAFSVISLLLSTACGTDGFKTVMVDAAVDASAAIILEVKNALPEEQVGDSLVRPNLKAFFCGAYQSKNPLVARDRCVRLKGPIENGQTKYFLIPRHELTKATL